MRGGLNRRRRKRYLDLHGIFYLETRPMKTGPRIFSSMPQTSVFSIMMNNQPTPTNIQLPKPNCEWSAIDAMQVGASLLSHTDLYGRLHDAVTYRARRDKKKFKRGSEGRPSLWRLA